jgi:hypothetical protein
MALCPFADKRWLIPPPASDPRIRPRLAILHSDGGNVYNLGPYFDGRSGGIESHFHIAKDGTLFQYRDTSWEADANYLANPFAISIETQGTGYEPWTPEQINTIVRLLLWLNTKHDIPLRLARQWDGAGIGWHIQFGSPGKWTNQAKICPGPLRIKQVTDAVIPRLKGDEYDMAELDDLRKIIREEVGNARIVVDTKGKGAADDETQPLNAVLRRLLNDEGNIKKAIAANADRVRDAILAQIGAIPVGENPDCITRVEVQAAVEAGIRSVLGGLDQ